MVPDTAPEIVCSELIAAGGLGLTLGVNLFSGPPRPALDDNSVPRSAVFCYPYFSFMPRPYIGIAEDYRDFRVMITVRHVQDKFREGVDLARAIWSTLQRANVDAYAGYFGLLMAEGDVTYYGLDDTDNHRWSMTARVMFKG